MENPFDKVYETDAHHASVLAQAFISAHEVSDVYACLRFADAAGARYGGFFGAYLYGCHFDDYTDRNGELLPGAFEELRNLANKFKDDAPSLWRLSLGA